MKKHKAIILTIGDELLIGQVVDTNSAWMGQELSKYGIAIVEKLAVSDTREGILAGLKHATETADIILVTGGLGPTKDDITKKVLAEFYSDTMKFDDPTYQRILGLFERWGRQTTAAHKEQCYMPASAHILENKMGTAPGMLFRQDGHLLVSMPGVPYEMKYLMENHVMPLLRSEYIGQAIVHKTILTVGEGESRIADRIAYIVDNLPSHISIAYLPSLGKVRLRLTAEGRHEAALATEVEIYSQQIVNELGLLVFGFDQESLVSAIGKICKEKGLTIGTAESCTGGKVASMIVNEAGSSSFYQGSLITYSNELKIKMLGVKAATLADHGAVSEQTVREMVVGAVSALDVDVAVAVSGIAGPSGGSDDKPVGTIWMACGNKDRIITHLVKAGKDRSKNIEYASNYALDLVRKFMVDI